MTQDNRTTKKTPVDSIEASTDVRPSTSDSSQDTIEGKTGSIALEHTLLEGDNDGRPESLKQEIDERDPKVCDDVYGGRVYPIEEKKEVTTYRSLSSEPMRKIMSKIGITYEVTDDGTLTQIYFPDPDRLSNAARINEIPIEFATDSTGEFGRISASNYALVVSQGKHPVGINSISYYTHDIKVDHMPAVIVCGDELFKIFQTGSKYMDGVAHSYDIFTSNISRAIIAILEGDQERFDQLTGVVCPGILNGYREGNAVDNGVKEALKQAILNGLERLGIEYPTMTQ